MLILKKIQDGVDVVSPIRQDIRSAKFHRFQHLIDSNTIMTLPARKFKA